MTNTPELERLVAVVDQIDPGVLTKADVDEIKAWGADKVGFILVDMDTQQILFATQGAEEIFGYMRDEMTGLDLVAIVPEQYRSIHPRHVANFNASPRSRSMGKSESPLYGKERDGAIFPVEIGLFPRKWKAKRLCLANVVRLSKET
jgi:PAS domain S-box-containing protein